MWTFKVIIISPYKKRTSLTSTIFIISVGIFQATLDDVDHSLFSHLRSRHKVHDVIDCLKKCQDDLQCPSFNFQYTTVVSRKNNCELNGVTRGQDPKNFVRRPGYTYYENVEWLGKSRSPKRSWKKMLFEMGLKRAPFSYILLAASKQDKSEIELVLNDLFWN